MKILSIFMLMGVPMGHECFFRKKVFCKKEKVLKKELRTPLEEREIKKLHLGDIVYLTGKIYTARDKAHHRIIKYEMEAL